MNLKSFKNAFLFFAQTSILSAITVFAVIPFSCKVSTEGIQIIGGDYSSPVVEDLSVLSDRALQVTFSEKVSVKSALLSDEDKIPLSIQCDSDHKVLTFIFSSPTQIGRSYEFCALVEDSIGNSLTFSTQFTGYNSRLPDIIITESQVKYTKATLKNAVEYRSEYVEFLVLSDGNLAGLRLMSASDGEAKAYDFPAVEVSRGQVFVLHVRSAGEGCISEEGEDLTLASARFSSACRDLWSENTGARFHDTSDVIFLFDKSSKKVLDGFMYAAEAAESWSSDCQTAAENLVLAGICDSAEIGAAAVSSGLSPLKSFHRLDAEEILEKIMAGESLDYPVKNRGSLWEVKSVDPGQI